LLANFSTSVAFIQKTSFEDGKAYFFYLRLYKKFAFFVKCSGVV